MKKLLFYLLFIIVFTSFNTDIQKSGAFDSSGVGGRKKNPVNIHIISIGIDSTAGFRVFKNCVNDAQALVEKIKNDKAPFIKESTTRGSNKNNSRDNKNDNEEGQVFSYVLLNEQATLPNIKEALKEVIKNSSTNDYFILFFAGTTFEISTGDTIIVPYFDKTNVNEEKYIANYKNYDYLTIMALANYMNQISAAKQLVISEAGPGKSFSTNLKAALYESDPDIALNSERNRVILTTISYGRDATKCDPHHGPLTRYVLDNGNMLDIFHHYYAYEYKLNKSEIACSYQDARYYYLSQEKDYKEIVARHTSSSGTRGAIGKKVKVDAPKEDGEAVIHALVIATDTYNKEQTSWNDLRTPLNDANRIAQILEDKYNVSVTKLYNEPRDKIKKGIIALKKQIGENDKLLVFVAGHGYFSEDYSQGFLVTTDSNTLEIDDTFNSYFSLESLKLLLDNFPCKQVFTIMDVCYGASFQLNNADVSIENYANTKMDNGLDKFILEIDKSISRIVLASGEQEVFDYWKEDQDHSPFASKLIMAFENEKEFISPGKIYSYVRGNTTAPILKKFGKHEVTGDFLLKVK